MLADMLLVARKDLIEMVLRQGGRANVVNTVLVLFVFGVVIPVRSGYLWVRYPMFVLTWVWLPLLLVSALVADSFAGERERHTLETLLATRLSDTAILFGKVLAAVAYAYSMLLALMVTSLLSVNVALGTWKNPQLWSPAVTLGILGFGLLVTMLVATLGVSVSLRSETVRQAGQRLSLGLVLVFTLPLVLLGGIAEALPAPARDALVEWLSLLDGGLVTAVVAGVLLLADAGLLLRAMRRFKRAELSLD